jgi:erythromycin esterase
LVFGIFNTKAVTMTSLNDEIVKRSHPLNSSKDLKPLLDHIKKAKVVMLGEASHGTHEFYQWRFQISKILIEKFGFNFIAVEGDWPPCQAVNQYVKYEVGKDALSVLKNFDRWPTWMWANTDVCDLVEWMRGRGAGFHGLDVYSLFESIDAVIKILNRVNPKLAQQAKENYSCFDPYRRDEKAYIRSLLKLSDSCRTEVYDTLQTLLHARLAKDSESLFDATQNARIVKNAEHYYRAMIHAEETTWNIRDHHMMETLEILFERYGPNAKGIVWEHNTHIGDYRATDMIQYGQVNIGGLAREQYGEDQVALVGFGTYEGTVTASHAWDGPVQMMNVPPGRAGSYEEAFHHSTQKVGADDYYILMDRDARLTELGKKRGHRAIGVVYDPDHERWGNYVPTELANRYDAFVFIDQTQSLIPLFVDYKRHEIPETFPGGF